MTTCRESDERARRGFYKAAAEAVDVAGAPAISLARRAAGGPPQRIGVLAASFNPPTKAHLKMAETARASHGCGEVLMELAKANVDKKVEGAPLHERLMMLSILAEGRGWMSIGVGSHGRFLDKAAAVRELYPSAEIAFIAGYDTFVRVFDGKYYQDREAELDRLFSAASFLCANRLQDGAAAVERLLDRPENRRFRGSAQTMLLPQSYAEMSSSSARAHLARSQDGAAELTPAVAEYIARRKLYR